MKVSKGLHTLRVLVLGFIECAAGNSRSLFRFFHLVVVRQTYLICVRNIGWLLLIACRHCGHRREPRLSGLRGRRGEPTYRAARQYVGKHSRQAPRAMLPRSATAPTSANRTAVTAKAILVARSSGCMLNPLKAPTSAAVKITPKTKVNTFLTPVRRGNADQLRLPSSMWKSNW